MDNRRLLIALVLTFGVLFAWSVLFAPPPPAPGPPVDPVAIASPAEPTATPVGAAPGGLAPEATPPPQDEVVEAAGAREIRIRTDLYDVTVSNLGGTLRSWKLLRYAAHVTLPDETSEPVELIAQDATASHWPLAVVSGRAELDRQLAAARFLIEGQDATLGAGETATVRLRWSDGRGSVVEKELTFTGGSYVVGTRVRARLPDGVRAMVLIGPMANWVDKGTTSAYTDRAVLLHGSSDLDRRDPHQVSLKEIGQATGGRWPPEDGRWLDRLEAAGQIERYAGVAWAAVEQNYFAGIVFQERPFSEVAVVPLVASLDKAPQIALGLPLAPPDEGGALESLGWRESRFSLYGGPKDTAVLAPIRPDLARVVEFGFFESLAEILLVGLKFFYGYVGNYGIAIMLLTLVVKVLFLPLTIKQLHTMQRMAKLRPQLKQIEERYGRARTDPKERLEANRKKNAEVMALYQREGVNPASGCLPMLLQLPVLYGFYSLLAVAIELRHAPFTLWIQDLSAKDPFYVTPLLMMLSMLVTQAITPTTADPMQQRIMYIMPIVFGWFFKDLASGLVLYWLTSNVLSIIQQMYMNRLTARREQQEKDEKRSLRGRRMQKGAERT